MRNYTKPSAEVVELTVKEPVSLLEPTSTKHTFGFGSKNKKEKSITLTTYAGNGVSTVG